MTGMTPGQAARSTWNDHWAGPDPYPAGQTQQQTFDALWDRVAQAVLTAALVDAGVARLHAENGQLRADLADAETLAKRWPTCPDGCGCRLGDTLDGAGDADRADCGCDGPCTMECRENGYPDAMSYRDLAVKHAMDERDEAHELLTQAADALWQIAKAALVIKPLLDKPYPEAPEWTPWTRWMERRARTAHDLKIKICKHLKGGIVAAAEADQRAGLEQP